MGRKVEMITKNNTPRSLSAERQQSTERMNGERNTKGRRCFLRKVELDRWCNWEKTQSIRFLFLTEVRMKHSRSGATPCQASLHPISIQSYPFHSNPPPPHVTRVKARIPPECAPNER
ncbi:hypothetical protein CEXT_533081 [Caerostris extrusa]|uniref:Uncharacterized protein n=1 Tax=Caerostris extrusa TaxID=172846 RepID=A0AAV4MVT5_CAEEX|nr:hypothetical protein CEXT_533081 [Caerostris extrusa]